MNADTINKLEILCKQFDHYKFKIRFGRIEIISEINKFTSNFLDKLIKLKLVFIIENETIYIYTNENE